MQGGHMANKVWRCGQSRREAGHKAGPWLTHGGQSLETRPLRTHGRQGRHKADKAGSRRTRGGHMVDKAGSRRTRGGHRADKLRGRGQSISRPGFFSKKEPHYTSIDPKQFLKHRVRLQRPNLGNQNECQGN